MSWSYLLSNYWQRLKTRLGREVLAAVGIAGGVALVFAALIANASLSSTVDSLARGIVGDAQLQLIARGPAGIDERVVESVEAIEGVESAAPVVEQRANVVTADGTSASVLLLGGDARFAALGGRLVRTLSAPQIDQLRAIALPRPLAQRIGSQTSDLLTVESGAGRVRVPLGQQLREDEIGGLVHAPVALMPLPLAQQAAGLRGRVSRIFVRTAPSEVERVARALRPLADSVGANVRAADADIEVFNQAAYPTEQSTAMFALLAALVGFIFAGCAVLLTRPLRRGNLNMLRSTGASTAALLRVVLLEAIALGVIATAVGLFLGDQLSRHVLNGAPGYLAAGWPIGNQRVIPTTTVAAAAVGGMLVALLAVVLPLWRDLTERPANDTLVRGTKATVAGAICLAAAGAIAAARPAWAAAGLISLTLGLMLLLPSVMRMVVSLAGALALRVRSPALINAAERLPSSARGPLGVALATTAALAVFAPLSIGGAREDLVRGLHGSARAVDDNADIWVTFRGDTSAFAVTPFTITDRMLAKLSDIDEIERVDRYRGSWLDLDDDRRVWVQAPPGDARAAAPAGQLRSGDAATANERLAAGGSVVIAQVIADSEGVDVGDTITLPTPRPVRLSVAAISNNLGWPSGAVVMSADDYARAWENDAPSALQVHLADGASPAAAAAAVRQALGPDSPLIVETHADRIQLHVEAADQGLIRLSQITALVLVAAVLALAAAMSGVIAQRRERIAERKTFGATTGQMLRSLLLEAGALIGAGAVAGAAAGLLGQWLLTRALATITGFPVEYSTAAATAAAILAGVTLVAVAIIAVPGWRAASVAASDR